MKRTIYFLIFTIATFSIIISCNDDDEDTIHDTEAVDLHLLAENTALDIYKQVQEVIKDTMLHLMPEDEKTIIEFQKGCAKIEFYSHDTLQYDSIRIEYGAGCTGINDYTREGTLVILLDGKYTKPYTSIIVKPDEFYFNSNTLKVGSCIIKCQDKIEEQPVDSLIINNLYFKDYDLSWDCNYAIAWTSGSETAYPNVGDDIYEINGESSSSYGDIDIANEIAIPLKYSLSCKCVTLGVSELEASNTNGKFSIDYGNGSCENIAKCTIDGKEYQLTID